MNSFIFGLIFMQVSIFFIAGFLLMTILYKKLTGRSERAAEHVIINRIRARRIRI